MVTEINQNEFDEKVKQSGKVLVDCFAEWCGPCRMLGPVVEKVSEEIDSCLFYKLNVDNAEEISTKYGIMSIPTLLLFENGELKKTSVGYVGEEELKEFIG